MKVTDKRWFLLVLANALAVCVLSFYRTSGAAPQGAQPPFANAVDQRNEMIRELQEIRVLLQEQNALLRAESAPKPAASNRRSDR
jgi:hypothetical protein